MSLLLLIFWFSFGILFLTYIAYAGITTLGARFQSRERVYTKQAYFPALTVLIAAYNEEDYIREKIQNTLALDYPKQKIKILVVTDGSTDNTNKIVKEFEGVHLLYEPARNGKIAAVDRAMAYVETPITVFTDANTMLNEEALKKMMGHFSNPKIGAVAGEKKVKSGDGASAKGENLYWRYESYLKAKDALWHSVVGAAGELYAIRTDLFESVPVDTLLDDFQITLNIAKKGYKVAYESGAYAIENASLNLQEEMKRKVRICAGGFQSIARLGDLANPLKYGTLSIQYLIHRVFRWTLAPIALLLLLLANLGLAFQGLLFYDLSLGLQISFYLLALIGGLLPNRQWPIPGFYVPCYFTMMHWCAYLGYWRFIKKEQSVNWAKAKRA